MAIKRVLLDGIINVLVEVSSDVKSSEPISARMLFYDSASEIEPSELICLMKHSVARS